MPFANTLQIGHKYAANIQAQKAYSCHLQNKNSQHSLFMTPTDPMDGDS